jgi:hypothetical protein
MVYKSIDVRGDMFIELCWHSKESRNRPGVAQRVPGGLGSQISWHSAHEGGEVASLMHWLPLLPGMFLVLIFIRGWVDPRAMVRSEGNMSLKNPVTLPGIDPGTAQLGAQRVNHYATPGPADSSRHLLTIWNVWSVLLLLWHVVCTFPEILHVFLSKLPVTVKAWPFCCWTFSVKWLLCLPVYLTQELAVIELILLTTKGSYQVTG